MFLNSFSKTPVYNGQEPTSEYRKLVRIESTGRGIPKGITEILEQEKFEQLV